uniref:Pentatricopeptide repeat-containing protein At5g06540 family n=1 Tax=Rhizophora mucronata TaxID=61149 RepID=A0A2P2NIP6_RHIMU
MILISEKSEQASMHKSFGFFSLSVLMTKPQLPVLIFQKVIIFLKVMADSALTIGIGFFLRQEMKNKKVDMQLLTEGFLWILTHNS